MPQITPPWLIEEAPALLPYGEQAPRMAALVRVRPSLATRVLFAPRPALHATAAFLHLAAEAAGPDAEVAARIEGTDPRKLLRLAIPDAPAVLYRALARAGDEAQDKAFYERLGRLAHSPVSDVLIGSLPLSNERLDWAEAFLAMDPALVPLRAALQTRKAAANLNQVVVLLRSHGIEPAQYLDLPAGSGLNAIVRRVRSVLDALPAAQAGFTVPLPWRIIGSIGELRGIGRRLDNCLASNWHGIEYWLRLLDGSAVFVACAEPDGVAEIRRVGPGLWALAEFCGKDSHMDNQPSGEALTAALVAAGVNLVPQPPFRAFAYLARYVGDKEEEGEDCGLEALEDDFLAA